jgi:hypothetical protein
LRAPSFDPAGILRALNDREVGEGANFTLTTTHGDLDVMQEVPGMSAYGPLADRALSTELDNVPVRVLALNDLIELKRAADRPLDRADVLVLSEIARLDAPQPGRWRAE